jgi:hypothetical protein
MKIKLNVRACGKRNTTLSRFNRTTLFDEGGNKGDVAAVASSQLSIGRYQTPGVPLKVQLPLKEVFISQFKSRRYERRHIDTAVWAKGNSLRIDEDDLAICA